MRKICVILSLIITFMSISKAEAYSTIYVSPDPYMQMGESIGNMIDELINDANQKAAEKALQETKKEAEEATQARANRDLESLIYSTSIYGINGTIDDIKNAVFRHGVNLDVREYENIIEIIYQENLDGLIVNVNYAYKTDIKECRVIIEVPEWNIRKVAYGPYSEPQQSQQTEAEELTQSISQYLGIVISNDKTADGGFSILEVVPYSLSDFAGIKAGDVLVKIDTYSLKEHDIDRVAAYIALRHRQKQVIRVTVLRDGKPIVIPIQL